MTDEQSALARRAVACRGWRWMPGTSYWWCKSQHRVADEERGTLRTDGSLLPDLTDPATVGCLLSLLLTAARARCVVVEIEDDWRTRHAEVRLVDLVDGGYKVRAAFVDMPFGEAVALALLSLEDAPA